MIKVKMQYLVNCSDTLQKLANMNLKARLAWKVARILKIVDEEMQSFNKTRVEIVKKYGNKDENGKLIVDDNGNCKVENENLDAFNTELSEIMTETVEIAASRIKIDEIEDLNFTPAEMVQLEPFIDMDEE